MKVLYSMEQHLHAWEGNLKTENLKMRWEKKNHTFKETFYHHSNKRKVLSWISALLRKQSLWSDGKTKIDPDRQTKSSNVFERQCCETCWTRAATISLREILSLKTTCYCRISISCEADLSWNTTTESCTIIKGWSFITMKNCKNSKVDGKLTFLVANS